MSGVAYQHCREAEPGAAILKLGLTYPLPLETIRRFAASVERCVVIDQMLLPLLQMLNFFFD